MLEFYILKSGMDIFDLARAYGLGLLLFNLSASSGQGRDTRVYDYGIYYKIETLAAEEEIKHPSGQWEERTLALIPEDSPFLRNSDREAYRKYLDMLVSDRNSFLIGLWGRYHDLKSDVSLEKKRLVGIEPSAFKGFRASVLWKTQYSEGTQMEEYDILDLSLAGIGFANFAYQGSVGRGNRRGRIFFLPKPEQHNGVQVDHYDTIRRTLGTTWISSRVSVRVVLARAFIRIYRILWERKRAEAWEDAFNTVLYSAYDRTGTQYKPGGAGEVSLYLLNSLLDADNGIEILDTWNSLLNLGEVQGHETISLSLSEFVFTPSEENWHRYSAVHIKKMLEAQVNIRLYENNHLKEVLKYVK